MAVEPAAPRTPVSEGHPTVFVDTFTNGLLGPDVEMLGPVEDGGHIVVNTAPGCWGPMITPSIRGGHEVAQPVAVAGAEPGDAIAIRIKDIEVTSIATASGNDVLAGGQLQRRSVLRAGLPGLRRRSTPRRASRGSARSRCAASSCGADATPFKFTNGYTIAFDHAREARRDAAARGGGADRARGAPATRRCRRTRSRTRSSRSRPTTSSASPPGCARSWASSARRRPPRCPTRTTPATSAASSWARRTRYALTAEELARAPHRRPHGHRRRTRRRDPRLPGQGAGRRRLHGRHARAPGRRRDRRPHLRRRRAPSPSRSR